MFIPSQKQAIEIVNSYGTPVYVTDADSVREKAKLISAAFSGLKMNIFYAIKANFNPSIVQVIKGAGIYGIDAVSPFEIDLALQMGYQPNQIIFTPSNPSDEEMSHAGKKGVIQNLGSLSELKRFGEKFPGQKVSIRICPEVGAGECDKVTTGQIESKFGVSVSDIAKIKTICSTYNLKLIGIHSHIGSGFYSPDVFTQSVRAVCKIATAFEDIEFLDFGGGFGVQYHPNETEIDLKQFATSIKGIIADFNQTMGKEVELRIEPGKFIVTRSTVLLTKITTLKEKNGVTFVGVDSGFNTLIRPSMYGAYHHVVNLSRTEADDDLKQVSVVGNICETGDVFNESIALANPQEGDILAILATGGYGASMASNYNMRPLPAEVLIDGKIKLTRKRQTFQDIMMNFT